MTPTRPTTNRAGRPKFTKAEKMTAHHPITLDRAQQIAAEVAARYGVTVAPDAVKIVPTGTSGIVPMIWDEKTRTIQHVDRGEQAKAMLKRGAWNRPKPKPREPDPAIMTRRDLIAQHHANGASVPEIMAALALPKMTVRNDLAVLRLPANPAPRGPDPAMEARRAMMRRMHGEGATALDVAAAIYATEGRQYSPDVVQRMGKAMCGLLFRIPRKGKAAAPAAPRQPKPHKVRAPKVPCVASPRISASRHPKQRKKVIAGPSEAVQRIAARRQQAAALHAEGLPIGDIAERLGVGRDTARDDLKRQGLKPLIKRANDTAAPSRTAADWAREREERLARISDGLARGMSTKALAESEGVDFRTITRDMKLITRPEVPTDERRAVLPDMLAEPGTSLRALSFRFGVSMRTVTDDCRALRLPVPPIAWDADGGAVSRGRVHPRAEWVAGLPDMIARGMIVSEVVAAVGVSRKTVTRALADLGLQVQTNRRKVDAGKAAEFEARRNLVAEMFRAGSAQSEICAATGISRSVVYHDLLAMGLMGQK